MQRLGKMMSRRRIQRREEPTVVENLPVRVGKPRETCVEARGRTSRGGNVWNHLGQIEQQSMTSSQEITKVSPTNGAMEMIKAGITVFPWDVMHRTGALFNIEVLKKAVFVHLMKT